jgi:carbonic anhydrase
MMENTMDYLDSLTRRNSEFASNGFDANLKMMPSGKALIIGCVDPRVNPMDIFKLQPGEAAIYRNVGGRVNTALFETMALLRTVTQAATGGAGLDLNLIVLHHTDCGIKHCYCHAPKLLARHMGVAEEQLDTLEINDPYKAVAVDVAALKANPNLPASFTVTGLVYDVATGKVEVVVPPAQLRPQEA